MAPLSAYLGLFTGTLITGMGIYLYLHPLQGGPGWLVGSVPFLLMGYGLFRVGFSAYLLWRRRSGRLPPGALAFVGLATLLGCQSDPQANLRIRMPYHGECATCPVSRVDSLLRVFFPKGFVAASYDSTTQEVILDIDTQQVRWDTIRTVLLAYGYEVEEELPLDPILSPCCVVASAPSAPEQNPLALPAPEVTEGMTELEAELEADLLPESTPLSEKDLTLDEDLGGLEDINLDEDLGGSEGLGVEDLDLDADLDMGLEDLEGPPSKPKKPASPPK